MKLRTLLKSDLARTKGRLIVVGSAVAVGVTLLVVLAAFGTGIYRHILAPLLPQLPIGVLKVEPKLLSFGVFSIDTAKLTGGLDEAAVERLRKIDGVSKVHPIIGASFPMRAEGGERFVGRGVRVDLFGIGVAPELVAADVAKGYQFQDPGDAAPVVPVIVARRLLDLYNSTIASALNKPTLSAEAVIGFNFEMVLGSSFSGGTPDPAKVERRVAQIVGLSEHATLAGVTVPEPLMRRWNAKFGKETAPITGAYVVVDDPRNAGSVSAAIEAQGLKVDESAKSVAAAMTIATLGASMFAGTLLFLAGFAIAQTFFLLVRERKDELAVLRALGARRRDLRRLILAEATIVGFLAGGVGVAVGSVISLLLEQWLLTQTQHLPIRVSHIIALPIPLLAGAWLLGILSAWLGAAIPAARAAASHPASVLRS